MEVASADNDKRTSQECSVTQPEEELLRQPKDQVDSLTKRPTSEAECLQALKDDPDTMR